PRPAVLPGATLFRSCTASQPSSALSFAMGWTRLSNAPTWSSSRLSGGKRDAYSHPFSFAINKESPRRAPIVHVLSGRIRKGAASCSGDWGELMSRRLTIVLVLTDYPRRYKLLMLYPVGSPGPLPSFGLITISPDGAQGFTTSAGNICDVIKEKRHSTYDVSFGVLATSILTL